MSLTRYWIRFDPRDGARATPCGVTAFDREDALRLASEYLFAGGALPRIEEVIEDVDLGVLEVPVIWSPRVHPIHGPHVRGVWSPYWAVNPVTGRPWPVWGDLADRTVGSRTDDVVREGTRRGLFGRWMLLWLLGGVPLFVVLRSCVWG